MIESEFPEPDFQTACGWWSDMPTIWTPVGWKDHLFRFNVLWSGAIIARPNLNRRTEKWAGQGVQLTFAPSSTGKWDASSTAFTRQDDNMTRQGWNDCPAPVLWTEFSQDGLLLRQEVFGHIPGGGDVRTGAEPLFAWVRLSIAWVCKVMPLEERHGFVVKVNAPHFSSRMSMRDHQFIASMSLYPRRLRPQAGSHSARRGWRLLEAGGKVRLAVAPGSGCRVEFTPPHPKRADATMFDAFVYVGLPARAGARADLLVPMLPTERKVLDRELALGYDAALRQANRYWARRPRTLVSVRTPEEPVNQAVAANVKLAELIAEKNPADGNYSVLCGAMVYADLWSTPGSMALAAMDELGMHRQVDKYLRIFHSQQGTVTPPGGSFGLHPGYLSSPKTLTSIDWLSDHGALLWAISRHALLSGDRGFARRWLGAILRACEFIQYARRIKGHGGYEGVMPPAVATDRMTRIQALWNDGWMYKGLTSAVRLLRQLDCPRAEEFAREARQYRAAFQEALRDKLAGMPKWTDAGGRKHPFLPTALFGDVKAETRHAFYLDTGPLFLVFAGLLPANDPLMRATLAWFRQGPQKRLFRHDGNCWQVPSLHREMSTCEPIYSWNVYHSHQLGDRRHFLEGLYSLLAGGLSRKTWIGSETRGGQSGTWFTFSLAFDLIRLAVADDQLREGELHLLRLCPPAWLSARTETAFDNLPTEFGPVDLRFRLRGGGRLLAVKFRPRFRHAPSRVVLHVPPVEGVKGLTVNGRPVRWDGKTRSAGL